MLWKISNLTLNGKNQPRLKDINIQIQKGSTAILGASAAGKSSLLNILIGLDKPTIGTCEYLPKKSADLPYYWVPQNYGLWEHYTVAEHLNTVSDNNELRTSQILKTLDLNNKINCKPYQLSQGECSRLAVARALLAPTSILVMDEPLSNVDDARKANFWQLIHDQTIAKQRSLIFATHEAEIALAYAQNVICLKDGKIIYEGETKTLYHQPKTKEQAQCLGKTNWLTTKDAKIWLKNSDKYGSHRPEDLTLNVDNNSDTILKKVVFMGTTSQIFLQSQSHHQSFIISSSNIPKIGDKVTINSIKILN